MLICFGPKLLAGFELQTPVGVVPSDLENMSTVDRLIALTDEDRQLLMKNRKAAWKLGSFLTIFLLLSLAILTVFHALVWLVVLLTFDFILAISIVSAFLKFRSFSKDLSLDQKEMISGPVEAQNIDVIRTSNEDENNPTTYRFWVQIGGKKITVTEDQYYQFKKGDLAEAFIAPNSGTVLGINKEYVKRPFG